MNFLITVCLIFVEWPHHNLIFKRYALCNACLRWHYYSSHRGDGRLPLLPLGNHCLLIVKQPFLRVTDLSQINKQRNGIHMKWT